MSDASASNVIFHNQGGFNCSFSIQWDGGETGRTEILSIGQTTTLDLRRYANLTTGTSCWARGYVYGGPNHDSGRNFTYDPNGGSVDYTISGGTLNPSFN